MRIKNNIGNTYWSIRSEWNMAKSTLTVKNTYSKGLNNLPGALKFEKMKNTKVLEMKNNSINIFLKCYCFFTFWSWIISFRQPSSLLLSSLLLSSLLLSSLLLSSLLLKRTETLRRRLILHLEKFFFSLSLDRQSLKYSRWKRMSWQHLDKTKKYWRPSLYLQGLQLRNVNQRMCT